MVIPASYIHLNTWRWKREQNRPWPSYNPIKHIILGSLLLILAPNRSFPASLTHSTHALRLSIHVEMNERTKPTLTFLLSNITYDLCYLLILVARIHSQPLPYTHWGLVYTWRWMSYRTEPRLSISHAQRPCICCCMNRCCSLHIGVYNGRYTAGFASGGKSSAPVGLLHTHLHPCFQDAPLEPMEKG